MTTASSIPSTPTASKKEMWKAFDRLPSKVRDALNYAKYGYSTDDVLLLHGLYDSGEKTADEIVYMIQSKDNFISVFGGWVNGSHRSSYR